MNSVLSAMPGPELIMKATLPANDAPRATPMAAISSSAWWTTPPNFSKMSLRKCEADVAGVIGYIEQSSMPDAIAPNASAWLPFMTTIGRSDAIAGTSIRKSRCSSAQR